MKYKEIQNNYQVHLCLNVLLPSHLHAYRPTPIRGSHLLLQSILFPVTYHRANNSLLLTYFLCLHPQSHLSTCFTGAKNKFLPFSHGNLLNHLLCYLGPDALAPVLLSIFLRVSQIQFPPVAIRNCYKTTQNLTDLKQHY